MKSNLTKTKIKKYRRILEPLATRYAKKPNGEINLDLYAGFMDGAFEVLENLETFKLWNPTAKASSLTG